MIDPGPKLEWFRETILPHQSALRYRIRRIAPDCDIDDIVAETLARVFAYENWPQIENGYAFMLRISRNILYDIARRASVISFDLMADLDELQRSVSYDAMFNARDDLRRLEKVLLTLPPQPRLVFRLRRIEDLSLTDIAAKLEISVSTVEKHLTRALVLITRGMADDEDWPSERTVQKQSEPRSDRGRSRAACDPS